MYLPVTFPIAMYRFTLAAFAAASVALAPLSLAQQSAVQGISLSSKVIVSGSTGAAPILVTTAPVQMMPAMTVGTATGGVVVLEDVEFPEPPAEMLGATPAGPGAKVSPKKEKPVDPKRVQKFQQAILDRTPSKILAEWSKAAPLTSAEDPELQDPPMPEEPAPKPKKPKAPKLQALERPVVPSELVAPVGSVADLAALAKAKREAEEDHDAEDHAEALAAYQAAEASDAELQAAYDASAA